MIDFWETLGRLACDLNLQNRVYTAFPITAYPQPKKFTVNLPKASYSAAQDMLAPKLGLGCLSLMAAGELVWGLNLQTVRDALLTLPAMIGVPAAVNPSAPNYFVALGVIVIDGQTRNDLLNGPANLLKPALPPLATAEENQLRQLSGNLAFTNAAATVCAARWAPACSAHLQFWDGHLHVLAQNR